MFNAVIALRHRDIADPFVLEVSVPAGDDERERAEKCAKITAHAMVSMSAQSHNCEWCGEVVRGGIYYEPEDDSGLPATEGWYCNAQCILAAS